MLRIPRVVVALAVLAVLPVPVLPFAHAANLGPAPDDGRQSSFPTTITNFDAGGGQVLKLDVDGDGVDAHDGDLLRVGPRYYLYGTSYDCGYGLQQAGAPFCGFKAYSSTDLVHWHDEGPLFDATTAQWQQRCAPPLFGCYRPHVVFNRRTHRYVLWINGYDNSSNYHVFTSRSPTGPFTEVAEPQLAINAGAPAGGHSNGDADVFVDDDGTAYLAVTDIASGHDIKVEKLDRTYTTGTGEFADLGVAPSEAPSMFRRGDRYYVAYSDPTCTYCSSTGTSYMTATSPLGPWTGTERRPGAWTITGDGTLRIDGGGVGLSRDGAGWTDYTFAFRARPLQPQGQTHAQAGWVMRYAGTNAYHMLALGNFPHPGAEGGNLTRIAPGPFGFEQREVRPLPFAVETGRWYDVETTVQGSMIETRIDGQLVDTWQDARFTAGRVGFREGAGEAAEFDDVRVTAPDGVTLLAEDFSGDLAHWQRPRRWQGHRINTTSCGGQPSFVGTVPTPDGDGYVFGSDLWQHIPGQGLFGVRFNQALAGYFWQQLRFDPDGSIAPYSCDERVTLRLTAGRPERDKRPLDAGSTNGLFRVAGDLEALGIPHADIGSVTRAQTFTASRPGRLRELRVTTFQTPEWPRIPPDAPLVLELRRAGANGVPAEVLASHEIPTSQVGWSPREVALPANVRVRAGERLAVVLRSATSRGAYGFAYDDADPYPGGEALYSTDGGATWRAETGRDLRFEASMGVLP